MVTFEELFADAITIWSGGGWAMWAIAAIAFVMFAMGVHVALNLASKRLGRAPESEWRVWIHRPAERRGSIGEFLNFVGGKESGRSPKEVTLAFRGLRQSECAPFERDLRVMKTCVSAAPLVGLLGTVTGMLSTFSALSSGPGGDQTMGMIAEGISEALITTETGLVIALPGLFFQYFLTRSFERYKVFLEYLETVYIQSLFTENGVEKRKAARRIAKARIARILRQRMRERSQLQGRSGELAGQSPLNLASLASVEA